MWDFEQIKLLKVKTLEMKAIIKKVSSILFMWISTLFAFVILAVSVVLMVVESLVSVVWSPARAEKKANRVSVKRT